MTSTNQPEKIVLSDLTGDLASGSAKWSTGPASFLESAGVRMMITTLIVIFSITSLLLGFWYFAYPTANQLATELKQFPTSVPATMTPQEVVDVLSRRQAAYTENFRGMFQLLVLSGLVPIFTLLAGYVFGKSK